MKIFKINDHIDILCESQNTRYGFRHVATLFLNGREVCKDKICYYNRTWERYEFEDALSKVACKADKNYAIDQEDQRKIYEFIKNYH